MNRRIKIEQLGDPAHRRTHAGIRLKGKWLERLGFQAGGHAEIVALSPGLIQLKFTPVNSPTNLCPDTTR